MTDGLHGVVNEFSVGARFVDVTFEDGDRKGQYIRIYPDAGRIVLQHFATDHPREPTPSQGTKLARFSPFYRLFDAVEGGPFELFYVRPIGRVGFNPGSECPMSYFEF